MLHQALLSMEMGFSDDDIVQRELYRLWRDDARLTHFSGAIQECTGLTEPSPRRFSGLGTLLPSLPRKTLLHTSISPPVSAPVIKIAAQIIVDKHDPQLYY